MAESVAFCQVICRSFFVCVSLCGVLACMSVQVHICVCTCVWMDMLEGRHVGMCGSLRLTLGLFLSYPLYLTL